MIYVPGQKRELSQLDKKKNRHASMPSPSNQIAVEDIKRVQEVIAREGKQLVYTHYNLIVCCDRQVDMQKPTNHLENLFGRLGVHLSKRAYNQLELFVNSFPGNCYGMSADYDRQGVPVAFHITREELNIEKVNCLKNLILQIWKGSNGVVSKTEDRLIGQTIDEYLERWILQ
jgi:hypothetical protein